MIKIDYTKIPDYTPELENRVSANADALIDIGKEEWIRTRRKKKKPRKKSQQDQLREIEDGLVDSPVEDK